MRLLPEKKTLERSGLRLPWLVPSLFQDLSEARAAKKTSPVKQELLPPLAVGCKLGLPALHDVKERRAPLEALPQRGRAREAVEGLGTDLELPGVEESDHLEQG